MQTKGKQVIKILGTCKACYEKSYRNILADPEKKKARKKRSFLRQRDRNREFLRKFIGESGGCVDCGESNIVVLQFDHLIPEQKKYEVPELVAYGRSLALIQAEIIKCEIVCANCHIVRTANKFGSWRL